jgi:hypothetical protein
MAIPDRRITEEELSSFECSSRYLQHLKESFLHSMHQQGREWDLADGQVVLTVPASFDEVDIAAAGGSEVSFTRDQTIMQGAPNCTFRYKFASRSPNSP